MPQPERPKPGQGRTAARGGRQARPEPVVSGVAAKLLGLQETVGNEAVQRLLTASVGRAETDLSRPGDPCEQEAGRVAREVVAAPDSPAPRPPGQEPAPAGSAGAPPAGLPAAAREALRSAGQPLEADTRAFMEERFDRSFAGVRIHTGPGPEAAAAALHAKAFTVGRDVVFGRGRYDPHGGRELLAHELTHVAQLGHAEPLDSSGHPGAPAGAHPAISATAGAATVLRQPATPEEHAAQVQQITDYTSLARRIHTAISGLGTDEEAVYSALRTLGRDRSKLDLLEAAYLGAYGVSLEDDIRGDFSGSELDLALELISATEMELKARRFRTAVEGLGTDEEAIYAVLNSLGRDQAQIDQLKATYQRFYNEDLVWRINDEMSGQELAFALHLLRPPGATAGAVAAEGEGMRGQRMHWAPSGPGSGTDFERWASASTEAAAPAVSTSVTMNCWEAVLLMAHRQGTLRWQWIHDLYTSQQANWFNYLVNQLSPAGQVAYRPSEATPQVPVRGDVVFFDGAAHVALATGLRDGQGRTQILSFWPPPDVHPYTAGTIDQIKLTTIEELVRFMSDHNMGTPTVTFATPPW